MSQFFDSARWICGTAAANEAATQVQFSNSARWICDKAAANKAVTQIEFSSPARRICGTTAVNEAATQIELSSRARLISSTTAVNGAATQISQFAPASGEVREIESQMKPSGRPDMLVGPEEVPHDGPMPTELGKARLQTYRSVVIPRSSSKLLFPDSELSHSLVAESYRRVRTSLLRSQAKAGARSICISSAMAGEGKTITSMNIGLCCSQVPTLRVLLVDADLRTAGLSELMGCRRDPGLSELLGRAVGYEDAIAAADISNLYLLPAGRAASLPELFAGTEWKKFITWATECFNIIIVDTPPILPLADTELILAGCDCVVFVARSLRTPREMVRKAMEKFESKKLLGSIFNGTDSPRHHYEYYGEPGDPARPKERDSAKAFPSGVR